MVKLGQMDQATFEALRDEIIGGDVNNVHLVKGLDYKLLERVRKGEDVLSDKAKPSESSQDNDDQADKPQIDVDEEFAKMEEKEIQPLARQEIEKKGEMAPPPLAGRKRTRDDILKELKASRMAAAEKAKRSALGPKFMKVGQKRETSRIEKDDRGREVLITVDADGKVKRKVKKPVVDDSASIHNLLMPDKSAKPLGMEIIPVAPPPIDEDDGDIFEGVGTDYNPLGDISDDDDESGDSGEEDKKSKEAEPAGKSPPPRPLASEDSSMGPPPSKKRNWLGDSKDDDPAVNETPRNPMTDPTILAALKKASTINPVSQESNNEEEAAKAARRKKMLESHDRDADDMDLEFGSSRFGDQEDGEDSRVKLSVWGGGEDEDGGKGEGKAKRKRGVKKRKGDVNSAADVLKVMERRKGEGK